MDEKGPIYGVELIDDLPLNGGMRQAMPSRRELEQVAEDNERVVAGYEVLLAHYSRLRAEVEGWKETLIQVLEQACGDGSRHKEYNIDSFCIRAYCDAIEKLGDCGALEVESGIGRNAFGRRPAEAATQSRKASHD